MPKIDVTAAQRRRTREKLPPVSRREPQRVEKAVSPRVGRHGSPVPPFPWGQSRLLAQQTVQHRDHLGTGAGGLRHQPVVGTSEDTGNPTTATALDDMIDYSAKPMLYGEKTLQESGRELYEMIIRVANGEKTKAEKLGDYSLTTPHGTSYNNC